MTLELISFLQNEQNLLQTVKALDETSWLYTITNLHLIIEYYFYATFSTFSLLIKALAILFKRLYLSKASQASLLGLNDLCIYFPVLINL